MVFMVMVSYGDFTFMADKKYLPNQYRNNN
jgi:hypothetical protein